MVTASEIRDKCREFGIDKVGIVQAETLEHERDNLIAWLSNGFHANMSWMSREPEKRLDSRQIFPETRSVICAAFNYFTPHEHSNDPDCGKISRYAWGDDYHDVVKAKLRSLLDWIKDVSPEIDGVVCVDTAPLMDKAWAVKAGIGWLGKHSNVITKEYGSWIFLGSILLNAELEYDEHIVPDHCGNCTACIDACPTSAIVEPYVVDAGKCISYATIELRDELIPDEIADNLNGWLYGCDICQDVCPWNRFEQPSDRPEFAPRKNETSLELATIEVMTHDEYVERFRRSAVKRAKLSGLKRNAKALSAK